ncbi:MAG: DUF5050 domain-containing protein [Lachnospiraceae bacterium]|nr:DUF5050 domain-containing protein [Lachnospiraceae bacterium]
MRRLKICSLLTLFIFCMTACEEKQEGGKVSPPVTEVSKITADIKITEGVSKQKVTTTPKLTKVPERKINEIIKGEVWELGNSQANLLALGYICENEGMLYYKDLNHEGYLCVSKPDGTDKRVLSKDSPRAIQVVGDYIYYIDDGIQSNTYNRIKRVHKDGIEAEVLGEERAGSILVTEKGIFFNEVDYIGRMELDGSGTDIVFKREDGGDFGWFCIYGDSIITGGVSGGAKIEAVKLDGSEAVTLYNGAMYPQISGETLFFLKGTGNMSAVSLATGEEKEWKGTYGLRSVFFNGKLYYTNMRQISAITTSTDVVEVIYSENSDKIDTQVELYGVANNRLYFTEKTTDVDLPVFRFYDLETGEIGLVL